MKRLPQSINYFLILIFSTSVLAGCEQFQSQRSTPTPTPRLPLKKALDSRSDVPGYPIQVAPKDADFHFDRISKAGLSKFGNRMIESPEAWKTFHRVVLKRNPPDSQIDFSKFFVFVCSYDSKDPNQKSIEFDIDENGRFQYGCMSTLIGHPYGNEEDLFLFVLPRRGVRDLARHQWNVKKNRTIHQIPPGLEKPPNHFPGK